MSPPRETSLPQDASSTRNERRQFSLAGLMLAVTLISLGLGLARWEPLASYVLALILAPAVVRTARVAKRRGRNRGMPLSDIERGKLFVNCLAVVSCIHIVVWTAFLAASVLATLVAFALQDATGSIRTIPVWGGTVFVLVGCGLCFYYIVPWMWNEQ